MFLLSNPRVNALYYLDKVCSQPLTPYLHLSDMRLSVPGYTQQVARTLKATIVTLGKLRGLAMNATPTTMRNPEVLAGIPYMLRGR